MDSVNVNVHNSVESDFVFDTNEDNQIQQFLKFKDEFKGVLIGKS